MKKFPISNLFNRSKSQFSYLLIALFCLVIVVAFNNYAFSASANTPSPKAVKAEIVDVEKFSDIIDTVESKWQRDYESYFQRSFTNNARSANQVAKHLRDIRDRAGVNPAVIWAVPKPDFLRLMLITPDRQFVVKEIRGANSERLTKRAEELTAAIRDRSSLDYLPASRIIYSWLFEPLEQYLEAEQIDTLLLCTGSKLRSLPFAVLNDGEKFVIEKYNIARIPALGLTDTSYQAQAPADKTILAMGASKFAQLPPLPGVEIELDSIVSKLWSGKGRKILNQEFTVPNLIAAQQADKFDIVHIATHSKFSAGAPESSFIQFNDRRLSLDRVTDLKLDRSQVDLLVLSACETAVGDEDAEFGFAGLAIQAGVKSALASLWTINDVGTVVLMSEFYQQLRSTSIKAEALRKAQMNMLTSKVFVDQNQVRGSQVKIELPDYISDDTTQDFSHPFYWAGFTIVGNPW